MRFSAIIFAAALAGMVAAAPATKRSYVTDVGGAIKEFDDASGVTAAEDALNAASGGAIDKLEDKLGVTYAEETLHAERRSRRAAPGDLQTIGKGVKYIEDGTGITATEDFLNEEGGGALDAFEDKVGVTDVDKAIGAERK